MDFIPDKEFHPIFNRVSEVVDLKGAFSVDEVNERLERTIRGIKRSRRAGRLRKGRAGFIEKNLKRLEKAGFGKAVIKQASENPRQIVALTLRYGRKKAKKILLERAKRRIGVRMVRRSARRRRRKIRRRR